MRGALHSIIFILVSLTARAEDCKTTPDLAKFNGAAFHQRNFTWCHSLTTTDMMTQKMHRMGALKPGQRLHPFGTAAVLHIIDGRSPDEGRFHTDTVLSNIETMAEWDKGGGRLCLESNLGSTRYSLNEVAGVANIKQADILRRHWAYRNGQFVKVGEYAKSCLAPAAGQKIVADMRSAERAAWIKNMNQRCKTLMPAIDAKPLYRASWTHEINGTLKGPADPERVPLLTAEIDGALDQGAIVGVEYKPDFMLKGPWQNNGNHWSSVVARERRADGQCYYRIRNSWGLSCKYYREPQNCTAGNIWVKREDLIKHTDATTYIP